MTPHICNNCKKSFSQKGHLEDHMKRKRPCEKNNTIEELVEKKVQEALFTHLKIEPAPKLEKKVQEALSTQLKFEPAPKLEKKVQEALSTHLKIEPAPTLETSTMDYSKKTLKELIALCKEKGVKGYSGKKKADICTLLTDAPVPTTTSTTVQSNQMDYSTKTRNELIAICKEKNIKGYSGKKKEDILKLIQDKPSTEITPQTAIVNTSIVDIIPTTDITNIKYIDLFCGIGGFHQALKTVIPTSKCVMASDIDEHARFTYEANHHLAPVGDIKKIEIAEMPKFNLICGGFPCQAFSIAQWKDKKAFDDPRGTLFFEILKIVDFHKPKCLLLENVANLIKIQKGTVLQTLLTSLTTRGYKVSYQLLSPHQFGIPQNRERVYIVATASEKAFDFKDLSEKTSTCKLADILDTDVPEDHYIDPSKYVILNNAQIKTQAKSGLKFCGYLKGALRKVGAKEDTEHLSRVHKQLMRIYSTDGTHPTLAASETSGRYHIYEEATKRVRRLTLNECYKLMAYPHSFVKHTNKGVAYKHIGNSVCVRVIEEIVKEMLKQEVI